jgi:hypothetical protein
MGHRQLKERLAPNPTPTANRATDAPATGDRSAPATTSVATEPSRPATPARPGRAGAAKIPRPGDADQAGKGSSTGVRVGAHSTDPDRRPSAPAGPPDAPRDPLSRNSELRDTVDGAIPGYDTLSASQVVRRLDGLGPVELEAVSRHEANNRRRRTILFRTQQLLGNDDATASGIPSDDGASASSPD